MSLPPPTYLLVGGTKGLGLAAAKMLRDSKAASAIVVMGRTDPNEREIEFLRADLRTVKGAFDAVDLVQKRFPKGVDTVVFSNGIITTFALVRTPDGLEEDLQVSYLSRFIIMNEMMKRDLLVGRKRVFVFGFPGEKLTPSNIDDLNFQIPNTYKMWPAHMNTVVLNEAFAAALPNHYAGVQSYALNPGMIQTGIRDNVHGGAGTWKGWFVEKLIGMFGSSADTYANKVLKPLFTSDNPPGPSGQGFSNKGAPLERKGWVAEPGNVERAWVASQALVDGVLNKQ